VPILGKTQDELAVIPGIVPNLINLPAGCRFAPRCRSREEFEVLPATEEHPELLPAGSDHSVRCWLYHSSDATPGWVPPLASEVRS
jgi:oligopeptide/dipeptide ABC transporter ATP-binding protein